MKKKNIRKIVKEFERVSFDIIKRYNEPRAVSDANIKSSSLTHPYDEKSSLKFKKLVLGLIKYTDNIRLGYDDSLISIDIPDISSLKTQRSNHTNNNPGPMNSNLNIIIHIYKTHFNLSRGYNTSTYYDDDKIYDDLIDIIKSKVSEINRNNFESICDDISIESGILRDSNLDDILKEIDV